MTRQQQERIDQLATEYHSVSPRLDSHSLSYYVDCYATALPERCSACGREDVDHLGPDYIGHHFRVAVPVATFRIAPSGFKQDVTPPDLSFVRVPDDLAIVIERPEARRP